MSNASLIAREQAAPSRADYNAAQLDGATREYNAALATIRAAYDAAKAAGDTERAKALKAEGVALINARWGI